MVTHQKKLKTSPRMRNYLNILPSKINIVDSPLIYHGYALPCFVMSHKDKQKNLMVCILFLYYTSIYHRFYL